MYGCIKISITAAHITPPLQDQTLFALWDIKYLFHLEIKAVTHKTLALCVP